METFVFFFFFFIFQSNQRAICLAEDECRSSVARALRNKTNPCVRAAAWASERSATSGAPSRTRAAGQTTVEKPPESRLHRSAALPGFPCQGRGRSRADCLVFVCYRRTGKKKTEKKEIKREKLLRQSINFSHPADCSVMCSVISVFYCCCWCFVFRFTLRFRVFL